MIPRFIVSCPTPDPEGFAVYVHDRVLNATDCALITTDRSQACRYARYLTAEYAKLTPQHHTERPAHASRPAPDRDRT